MKSVLLVTLRKLIKKTLEDNLAERAAALSYYAVLALAPVVILLLSFASALGLSLDRELVAHARNLVGSDASPSFEMIIGKIYQLPKLGGLAAFGNIVVLIASGSIIFVQLQASLNQIFSTEENTAPRSGVWTKAREIIVRRLFSVGMLLSFILISGASLIVSVSLNLIEGSQWIAKIIQVCVNLLAFAVLFATAYRWVPDRPLSWRANWFGGIAASLLFVIGKGVIGTYISRMELSSTYGVGGSFIALLVWVYYSSLTVFFGAEVALTIHLKGNENEFLEKSQTA